MTVRAGGGADRPRSSGGTDAAPRLAQVSYLPGAAPAEPRIPVVEEARESEHDAEQDPEASGGGLDRAARRAENVSIAALTRRGQSRRELEKTLLSRELDPEVVATELERLEGVGLIDDAALAENIVRTQHERKGLGRSGIIAELRRRLIDQHHIDTALEQFDSEDEVDKAAELAERRARQMTSLDRETAVRRLTSYLMRKGYSSSVIRPAVDAALSGHLPRSSGGVRFR